MTVDALIYRSSKGVVSALLSLSNRAFGLLPLRLYPLLVVLLCGGWNRFTRRLARAQLEELKTKKKFDVRSSKFEVFGIGN